MVLSTWKKSTLSRPGTAQQFGSNDFNRVADLLNGLNVGPVEIGSTWNFTTPPSGITTPAGSITDSMVNGSANIAYAKLSLANSILDSDIAAQTSTKITIANKAHLPVDALYTNDAQTITNKTMDAGLNNFQELVQSPIQARQGRAMPRANTLLVDGAMSDHVITAAGTAANIFDTAEGICTNLPTTATANINGGLVSPTTGVGIGRRLFGMRARTRCKPVDVATNSRFYFGFNSATALPISDTPLATTDHGVLIGWRSTDTFYTVINNDGGGAAVNTVVTGNIAKDATFHTFEINWLASGNINVIMDGITLTLNTRIPATTTNLFFNQVAQTTTTVAKTQTIHGTWLEADK